MNSLKQNNQEQGSQSGKLEPGERVVFGETTVEQLKEKRKKEKSAKKKLPKNFKPTNH